MLDMRFVLLLSLLATTGCNTTRFPTWYPRPAELERRIYERHDPFPESETGPAVDTRPRAYHIQRTAPRRAVENHTLNGIAPTAPAPYPTIQPNSFPGTVQP